jgi:dihydrofolate synthase/folylpolyglutamate synthase
VHAAVVEVGLLGRWDSTNVIDAPVAVVTNVGTDHLDMAGSVEAIAYEKAGIVKPNSILVLGETDPNIVPVFLAEASAAVWQRDVDFACVDNLPAHGGRLLDLRTPGASYDGVYLPVHGRHQGDNAAIALAAAEAFFSEPLSAEDVNEAFAGASSPGRLEVIGRHPLVVLDGAHNPEGARVVARALAEEFGARPHRIVVFGTLRPHDATEMLTALDPGPIRLVVACEPPSPRALPAGEIVDAARAMGLEAVARPDVDEALALAVDQAGDDDLVVVTGSLTTVGAARAALRRHVR